MAVHHSAAVLAPLALAAVLALSGAAKLGDPDSTASVITLLRLPRVLHRRWVPRALPVGELLLAVALLAPWRAVFRIAAVAALLLFAAYWAIMARALTFDPRPTCGCFGRIGDQRVSPRTLVRNTLLLLLASWTLWLALSGGTVWSLLGGFTTGDLWWLVGSVLVAAVVALVAAGTSVLPLGGRHRPGARPAEPLPTSDDATSDDDLDYIRTPIPNGVLITPDAGPSTLLELVRDEAKALVFVTCACGSSHQAVARLPEWRAQLPGVGLELVSTVERDALRDNGVPLPADTYLDHRGLCYTALGCSGSPAAVLLGADGLLAGGPVRGVEEIDAFVAEIHEVLTTSP